MTTVLGVNVDDIWLSTASGQKLYLTRPEEYNFTIEEIARGLSHICRFNGQCSRFYSVAEHSLLVHDFVRDFYHGEDKKEIRLQALLHDATETYVGDLVSPMKAALPEFEKIEQKVWQAIAAQLDVPITLHRVVKEFDFLAALAEKRDLFKTPPVWESEYEFLSRERKQILENTQIPNLGLDRSYEEFMHEIANITGDNRW